MADLKTKDIYEKAVKIDNVGAELSRRKDKYAKIAAFTSFLEMFNMAGMFASNDPTIRTLLATSLLIPIYFWVKYNILYTLSQDAFKQANDLYNLPVNLDKDKKD